MTDRGPPSAWPDQDLEALCRSGIPGYDPWATAGPAHRFDVERARLALRFFSEALVFIEGARGGEPFHLEPWQAAIVGNLFGWIDGETGLRRYREAFVFVARKNGKTPLAAGIALYALLLDDEPGAQVYSAAPDRDQADLIFRHAAGMVARNPALDDACRIYRAFRSIEVNGTASFFRSLTSEVDTKHGLSTHVAIIDELHAHKTRGLVDVLQTSTGARRQPLLVYITTSDYGRESICNEKHRYATKVRDGALADPSFLPVIYEAAREDDWTKVETWRKANPNLGVSISEEYLRRECEKAKESPAYLSTFLRLHLNVRTNSEVAFFDLARWDACAGTRSTAELAAALEGRPCFAGLDLASTNDVTAFVLYFPDDGGAVLCFFWVPRENAAERERRHRVPYVAWGRDGFLELTDGNVVDQDLIEKRIVELSQRYRIRAVAFDRWGAENVTQHLRGAGLEVVPFGQGFGSMSAPTKALDVLVRSGRLAHGAHPVLRWMAANTQIERDPADSWKPSNKKSREKIDGIVALVMALGRAIAVPAPEPVPTAFALTLGEPEEPEAAGPSPP